MKTQGSLRKRPLEESSELEGDAYQQCMISRCKLPKSGLKTSLCPYIKQTRLAHLPGKEIREHTEFKLYVNCWASTILVKLVAYIL